MLLDRGCDRCFSTPGVVSKRLSIINAVFKARASSPRPWLTPSTAHQRSPITAAAAAAEAGMPGAAAPSSTTEEGVTFDFACPICHTTHLPLRQSGGRPTGDLRCARCNRTFAATPTYADLTLTAGVVQTSYEQKAWAGTEIFRNPLVSLAYERGWRQSFAWAGFPGVEREFELAMEYLRPAYGNTIVDMSCGSGLFSRRFLGSGRFAGVIAVDFSESMLREARQYFDQDTSVDSRRYILVRADVARLPFATGSVAAVHAGAAIHCWPNPQAALAEISRVLRPGGVFVASTFLSATAPLGAVLGDSLVRPLKALEPGGGSYRWWEEEELRDLCAAVGLQGFVRERKNRFIMFKVTKPKEGGEGAELS